MRHFCIRAAIAAALVGGVSLAFAFSTGPPASRTGAKAVAGKAAEPNCTLCHNLNPVNSPVGEVRILDVPTTYVPSQQYDIRIQLTHPWDPLPPDPVKWGFEITAVQASTGDSAGIWILGANAPPDTFKSQKPSTGTYVRRRYISHTRNVNHPIWPDGSTRIGEPGPVEWTLKWQAPPGDSGKIYFFAAGNSANGDAASFGSNDFIFTTAESTVAGGSVDVPIHPLPLHLSYTLDQPYPNPMEKCTNIDFTIPRGGMVDLAIYDLAGRRVRTLMHEFRDAGTHGWSWDGRRDGGTYLRNGVYFLRLRGPGEERILTRKIALARK